MAFKSSSKLLTGCWHTTSLIFNCTFTSHSPIVFATPDNTNANGIFTILFRDFLTEFHYDAKLAGLSFDLFTTHSGMNASNFSVMFYFFIMISFF